MLRTALRSINGVRRENSSRNISSSLSTLSFNIRRSPPSSRTLRTSTCSDCRWFCSSVSRESSAQTDNSKEATCQGKNNLSEAMRSSFIPSIRNKNKRSESQRQDEVFLTAFNSDDIKPLMTPTIIADTFWSLISKNENYPVIKAVKLLPHELYSNEVLHAGIIAFGRTNRPNKGLELVTSYYENEFNADIDRNASAVTLEHLLYSFCETDRLEASEEILFQWLNIIKTQTNENNVKIEADLILSAMQERVNSNRKNKLDEKKSEKESGSKSKSGKDKKSKDGKDSEKSVKKVESEMKMVILKEGDILDIDTLYTFREKHGFDNNIKFSKIQAYTALDKITDRQYEWEHSLDEEHSPEIATELASEIEGKEGAIDINQPIHLIDLYKIFNFSPTENENNSGISTQGSTQVPVPFPSDNILCKMVKMWSERGAWDNCISVCDHMMLRGIAPQGSSAGEDSVSTDEEFVRYNTLKTSPLSVCYRHTVTSLCANNQYLAALQLTAQVKKVGVKITASSLAQLLLSYEINEDLSGEKWDKVTLLDFESDILSAIFLAAEYDKKNFILMNKDRLRESDNDAINNWIDNNSEDNSINSDSDSNSSCNISGGTSSNSSGSSSNISSSNNNSSKNIAPFSHIVEVDFDQHGAGSLIFTYIKLLCQRGFVFKAEKLLLDLIKGGAGDSVPFECIAFMSQNLAARDQFTRSVLMFDYLYNICENNDFPGENHGFTDKPGFPSHSYVPGQTLESYKNRRVELSMKILPGCFHNICYQFRRAKDLESMMDFSGKYGPRIESMDLDFDLSGILKRRA